MSREKQTPYELNTEIVRQGRRLKISIQKKERSRYFRDVYSPSMYEAYENLRDDELLIVTAVSPYRNDKTRDDAKLRLGRFFNGAKILFDGEKRFFVVPPRLQKKGIGKRASFAVASPGVLLDTKHKKSR
jgi:hypothetical protein